MNYSPSNIIKNAINNNKLSHAYLFYGEAGVDIEQAVIESIQLIMNHYKINIKISDLENVNFYDYKVIKPDADYKIKKELVDSTISLLFEKPLEHNTIKILYIKNVDAGNKSSLNRLLKFIEEPVDDLIIFMSTNYFDNVISTIRSRTQNIYVKRENAIEKIQTFEQILGENKPKYINLLANIYANIKQVQQIDLNAFDQCVDQVLEAFEEANKNKEALKINLDLLWNKNNNNFVLWTIQYFYYQLMVDINNKYPLFPGHKKLIEKFKIKNIDSFFVQLIIEKTKKAISIHGNFEIQKMALLNELVKHC